MRGLKKLHENGDRYRFRRTLRLYERIGIRADSLKSGGASRWRVGYQRGLHRLVHFHAVDVLAVNCRAVQFREAGRTDRGGLRPRCQEAVLAETGGAPNAAGAGGGLAGRLHRAGDCEKGQILGEIVAVFTNLKC